MIHVSLAAALLGAAPSSPALTLAPASMLPNDCFAVVEIGNLHSFMTADEGDRHPLAAAINDSNIVELLTEQMKEEEFDASEADIERTKTLVQRIESCAMGFRLGESVTMMVVAKPNGDLVEAVLEMARAEDLDVSEKELGDRHAWVIDDGNMTIIRDESHVFCVADSEKGTEDMMTDWLEAESSDQWWQKAPNRLSNPLMQASIKTEALADVDDLDDVPKEVFDYLDNIVIGIEVPDGAAEMSFAVNFKSQDVLKRIASLCGSTSEWLLTVAPKGAVSINTMNIDIPGLIELVIDLTDDEFDSREGFEDFTAEASGFLNVDFQSDILDNLTGDLFNVAWGSDLTAIMALDEDEVGENMDVFADAFGVYGFQIGDPEPFLQILDTVEGMGLAETSEDYGGTAVDLSSLGVPLALVVTDSTLYVGNGDKIGQVDALMKSGGTDGAFTKQDANDAIEFQGGFGHGLFDMKATAEFFELMPESMESELEACILFDSSWIIFKPI